MGDKIKIWCDPEGDYLEIIVRNEAGFFQDTDLDQVMEKVTPDGRVIGYSTLKVSSLKGSPIELSLPDPSDARSARRPSGGNRAAATRALSQHRLIVP